MPFTKLKSKLATCQPLLLLLLCNRIIKFSLVTFCMSTCCTEADILANLQLFIHICGWKKQKQKTRLYGWKTQSFGENMWHWKTFRSPEQPEWGTADPTQVQTCGRSQFVTDDTPQLLAYLDHVGNYTPLPRPHVTAVACKSVRQSMRSKIYPRRRNSFIGPPAERLATSRGKKTFSTLKPIFFFFLRLASLRLPTHIYVPPRSHVQIAPPSHREVPSTSEWKKIDVNNAESQLGISRCHRRGSSAELLAALRRNRSLVLLGCVQNPNGRCQWLNTDFLVFLRCRALL